MKFALITLVASLGASAVHGSTTGSRSLLTRGDNMARETLNVISGNGTNGSADADPSLNNTSLPPGTLKGTSMGNSTELPILSSHGNGSVNGSTNIPPPPMGPKDLPPLSPNATTSEKIANLEAKIADHKQKLERAESKLAKLKVGDGIEINGTCFTSEVPGTAINLTTPLLSADNSSEVNILPLEQ